MNYSLSSRLLSAVATNWPSPVAERSCRFDALPGTATYLRAYAEEQFMQRARRRLGIPIPIPSLWGKVALEIGCGHGGISVLLGSLGCRRVVGIDLNDTNLQCGRDLLEDVAACTGQPKLPVDFQCMDAGDMQFEPNTFDIAFADNLFEHVNDPRQVLAECRRVLKPEGHLIVPSFPSIWSKYGAHLKNGLKMPWVNVIAPEHTVVQALQLQATKRPELYEIYPGLSDDPRKLRDVRRYKDLNGLTYKTFQQLVREAGFSVLSFHKQPSGLCGKVIQRIPLVRDSWLGDVFSMTSTFVLKVARAD